MKVTPKYICYNNAYYYYDENGEFVISCDNNTADIKETEQQLKKMGYAVK